MHALRFGRIVALPSARNAAVPYVLTDVMSGGGALRPTAVLTVNLRRMGSF